MKNIRKNIYLFSSQNIKLDQCHLRDRQIVVKLVKYKQLIPIFHDNMSTYCRSKSADFSFLDRFLLKKDKRGLEHTLLLSEIKVSIRELESLSSSFPQLTG